MLRFQHAAMPLSKKKAAHLPTASKARVQAKTAQLKRPASAVDDVEEFDTSSITAQQRYCFDKALALEPGTPGSLPEDIKKKFIELKSGRPAQRNALINAVVPKDVAYKTVLKLDEHVVTKFKTMFMNKIDEKSAKGVSYTRLRSDLGHGDLAAGKIAIEEGLETGDIVMRENLYYMKEHVLTEARSETTGASASSSTSMTADEWMEVSSKLSGEEWGAFAIMNRREKALPDGHSETDSKPASPEASLRLEQAYKKCANTVKSVREQCCALQKLANTRKAEGKPVPGTLVTAVAEAVKMTDQLDVKNQQLSKMLVLESPTTTDSKIKLALKEVAPLCANLMQTNQDFVALLRSNTKSKKAK